MEKVNLSEKLVHLDEHWSPKIVAELNGHFVKLVKLLGEFSWHHHNEKDELFLVIEGRLGMEFRDRDVWLEGEMIAVPRGVENRPVAEGEVHVMLFEPAGTVNTGNATGRMTQEALDRI